MSSDARYKTTGNMYKEAGKVRDTELQKKISSSPNDGLMPGKVNNLTTDVDVTAALAISNQRLIVIDCFTEWCQPCKRIESHYLSLAQEQKYVDAGVLFFRADLDNPLLKQVTDDVTNVPTFKIFKGGNVITTIIGAKLELLKQKLNALV